MNGYYKTSSATSPWVSWVDDCTSSTSNGTSNYIWSQWAGTSAGESTWSVWVEGTYLTYGREKVSLPTPEELEAQRKAQEEWKRQQDEAYKARVRAEKKARKLFLEVVGRKQYKAFRRKKHLEIVASSGKRYRLKLHARVEEMDGPFGDKVKAHLCVHPDGVPAYDTLVTQLLYLLSGKDAEEKLVKTANRTPAAA